MNLARAFAELEAGAELYCLHKNAWWQTSRGPLLDSGAFVAGLEYAAGVEATILGKPSPAFFGAALDALDADPERTWMVGDDLEADIAGAKGSGLNTILVRTGKFREETLADALVKPDRGRGLDRRCARLSRRALDAGGRRPDRDRADRARARTVRRVPGPLLHRRRAGVLRQPRPSAQHYAARFAGKEAVGKALGCGVRFTWREIEIVGRPKPGVRLSGRTKAWAEKVRAGAIDLSMSHSKGLATAVCLVADQDA
jgi:phosphopantetheine--protein transferase-like protein